MCQFNADMSTPDDKKYFDEKQVKIFCHVCLSHSWIKYVDFCEKYSTTVSISEF